MNKRNILLTPGPTPVPPEALNIMAQPIFHHRTPQYRKIFNEASLGLKEIFQTKNNVYTFTSSGTGAMEAAVVNFTSPGDTVIVAHAGKFGERWVEISKHYGLNIVEVSAPYGNPVEPELIEKALKANPQAKVVFATHSETSTGVCHDIEGMAKVISQTPAILVVDAISGLGADALPQDQWNVDVVVSGSQKGLMLPPGLAFLSANPKAMALSQTSKNPKFYFNLKAYEKSLADSDTPYTSALTIVLALAQTVRMILAKGLANHLAETAKLAKATRAAMEAIGLELFAVKRPASGVTAVKVPAGVDGEKLTKIMRDDQGVTMAGGQGSMKGKIFRIAHMGFITKDDLLIGLEVLCGTLTSLGYQCSAEKAVSAFKNSLK